LSGVIPPTGSRAMLAGNTARQAFTALGGRISAGNILSPSAPAASAAKASVGVATPGSATMPSRLAAAMTSRSALGATISRPPAAGGGPRLDLGSGKDGARPRQQARAAGQVTQALQRLGAVQGNLDDAEAGAGQGIGGSGNFLGPDAAQNGDEGQILEQLSQH